MIFTNRFKLGESRGGEGGSTLRRAKRSSFPLYVGLAGGSTGDKDRRAKITAKLGGRVILVEEGEKALGGNPTVCR